MSNSMAMFTPGGFTWPVSGLTPHRGVACCPWLCGHLPEANGIVFGHTGIRLVCRHPWFAQCHAVQTGRLSAACLSGAGTLSGHLSRYLVVTMAGAAGAMD